MKKIKVVLVDKRELFRQGLAKILEEELGLHLETTCSCGLEGIAKAGELKPDVILLDTELSDFSYLEVTRCIREVSPQTRIIVLTHSERAKDLYSALRMGIRGYVSKDTKVEDLTKTITLVHEGKIVISAPMSGALLDQLSQFNQPYEVVEGKQVLNLSAREIEILSLVAKGARNQEIADSLFITKNTVKVHMRRIMQKLNVHNRRRAVALIMEKGMVPQVTNMVQQPR